MMGAGHGIDRESSLIKKKKGRAQKGTRAHEKTEHSKSRAEQERGTWERTE